MHLKTTAVKCKHLLIPRLNPSGFPPAGKLKQITNAMQTLNLSYVVSFRIYYVDFHQTNKL